jgi:GNAT superfamily N-acetyltransferase
MLLRYYRGILAAARRWGGPLLCVERAGELAGVAVVFDEGTYPIPWWSIVYTGSGVALAGPGPVARGLSVLSTFGRSFPSEPQVYLHTLAAHPSHQRGGVGAALLGRVIESASERALPVYLQTATVANVAYYRRFGFGVEGEDALPRGERVWYLRREPAELP